MVISIYMQIFKYSVSLINIFRHYYLCIPNYEKTQKTRRETVILLHYCILQDTII